MASQTIRSNQVTFLDTTDDRKIEVYIASNLPTVQIKNSNTGAYTPDWTKTNLTLVSSVFLDTQEITNNNQISFIWYRQIGTGAKTQISTNKTIMVATNDLSVDVGIITYICQATYQNIVAQEQITFTRVDTGKNGENGTGFSVKGTASSVAPISGTDYYTITYGAGVVTAATIGDAYLYNGNLYVCADSRNGEDYFVNVGNIQGPAGENARNIILTGNSQIFKTNKSGTTTPSTITVQATAVNTSVTSWAYSVNGGGFMEGLPAGITRNNNTVTITASTMTATSIAVRASDGQYSDVYTVYKVADGADGVDGEAGDSAPIAFLTNENISFSANSDGQIAMTTFTTNIVAYNGTNKTTPSIGNITGLPSGMTVGTPTAVSNELLLTFSIANNSTLGSVASNSGTITIPILSPVVTNLKLNWSKINTGATGQQGIPGQKGEDGQTSYFHVKYSAVANPTTAAQISDTPNTYIGTYVDFTAESSTDPSKYTWIQFKGGKGDQGIPGNNGINGQTSYLHIAYANNSTGTSGFDISNSVDKLYIGQYTDFTQADSTNPALYSWTKIKGEPGAPASLVKITPSALYFKSNMGKNGEFLPRNIFLYPVFQNTTYSNWQYSIDGGLTWLAAAGANGLSIGTHNGVPNTLAIYNTSTLYTDTVTSISFKCNTTNSAITDTVSVAKLYDVVDIQIGGTNLLKNSNREVTDTREFVRYADIAPIFDTYGIGEYTISFDIKSANITNRQTVQVYCQNGSNTRYTIGTVLVPVTTEYTRRHIVVTPTLFDVNIKEAWLAFYGQYDTGNIPTIKNVKIERGNKPTDWSFASEDIIEDAANTSVILSNESHLFEADSNGIPTPTTIILDVVGFKGATQVATTVGTITGLPSAGMEVSLTDNVTTNTKINIAVNGLLTSEISDYGVLTIPITVNGKVINKKFSWSKSKAGVAGTPGADAVTFQVYSSNGFALSTNKPVTTLTTFAYIGDVEITAGAEYQWYSGTDDVWAPISGAEKAYLDISREDVSYSNNYMCKMTFNGVEYTGVVTVDDKNDETKIFTSKPTSYTAGDLWVVGSDYIPSGVTAGTLLRAEHTNTSYQDSDWVTGTKYDTEIDELKSDIQTYKQHFSFDQDEGIRISARDANGNQSKFATVLSNTKLSFNEGATEVASISSNKMHIKEAEIESPLTVTGSYSGSTMLQAPVINIGNFSIIVESNGSLSIVSNT